MEDKKVVSFYKLNESEKTELKNQFGYNKEIALNDEIRKIEEQIKLLNETLLNLKEQYKALKVQKSNSKGAIASRKYFMSISARNRHTVGLKSDGTVVAVGQNYYGQCDVKDWKDIKVY